MLNNKDSAGAASVRAGVRASIGVHFDHMFIIDTTLVFTHCLLLEHIFYKYSKNRYE